MRRGSGADIVFYKIDEFIGVNLGSDACTEHECGIGDIRNSFGMDSTKQGIEKRTITTIPPESLSKNLRLVTKNDKTCIAFERKHLDVFESNELMLFKDAIAGAWDESTFAVLTNKYHAEFKILCLNKNSIILRSEKMNWRLLFQISPVLKLQKR